MICFILFNRSDAVVVIPNANGAEQKSDQSNEERGVHNVTPSSLTPGENDSQTDEIVSQDDLEEKLLCDIEHDEEEEAKKHEGETNEAQAPTLIRAGVASGALQVSPEKQAKVDVKVEKVSLFYVS